MKRLAGLVACLLGSVGILLGVVAAFYVYQGQTWADETVEEVSERIDGGLKTASDKSNEIRGHIVRTREFAASINTSVQGWIADRNEIPVELAPGIDSIERDFRARIQLAQDWVEVAQAGVDFVEQVATLLEEGRLLATSDLEAKGELLESLRAVREELSTTVDLAQQVETSLEDLKESRDLESSAAQIETLAGKVGDSLRRLDELGERVTNAIEGTRSRVGEISTQLQRRLVQLSIVLYVLIAWQTLAQGCLLRTGLSWLLGPSKQQAATAEKPLK